MIKPINDKILVKRDKSKEQTDGGIFIPETSQEKTQEGVVIAISDTQEFSVKPLDLILFNRYAGTDITIEDEEYIMLGEDDILAVLKK